MEQLNTEQNQKFGVVLEAMRSGKAIARKEWIPQGKFIFMQIPATIPKEVIPKMQSLPDSIKYSFEKMGFEQISYCDQIAMLDERGFIVGYCPSITDILAEDWNVIN